MEIILNSILENAPDTKYRVRYVDYEKGVWTLPLLLNYRRIKELANDASLDVCELQFSNGEIIILHKKQ